MTTLYFGERWDAPMLDGDMATQVDTPIGMKCYQCGEPIAAGDRGLLRALISDRATVRPIHMECDLRSAIGHEYQVCPCFGYGMDREAGRETLRRLNLKREQWGQPAIAANPLWQHRPAVKQPAESHGGPRSGAPEGDAMPEDDDLARFLTGCQREHDQDPDEWHRQMMLTPRVRGDHCRFCGMAWPNTTGAGS